MQPPIQSTGTVDRTVLRADLETTHQAFRDLVASVGGQGWHRRSSSTDWTNGQVLQHVLDALVRLPTEIEHARRGRDYLNPPQWLLPLMPRLNWFITCWHARGQTPARLLEGYEAAHRAALAAIDDVGDDEWQLGAHYFGEGYRTILGLCQMPNWHFRDHAAQVR
jgi:hypothetical protein